MPSLLSRFLQTSSRLLGGVLGHFIIQSLSHVWLFETPWTVARQASLSITNSQAYSNSCPWSRWCHPTISSSVVPFFSCLQSFPASGSFPMSLFFPSGGQRIGASASASVLPVNIQDWFPLELTGLTYWAITKISNWELILLPLNILFTSVLSLCLVYNFEGLNFWNKCILNLRRFNYRYLSSLLIGV